jgi:hypothetical protein
LISPTKPPCALLLTLTAIQPASRISCLPKCKLAVLMDEAEADVLAFPSSDDPIVKLPTVAA